MDDLIRNNFKAKRLEFTSDLEKAVNDSQLNFGGTPTKKGSNLVDLSQVFNVAKSISKYIKVIKTLLPNQLCQLQLEMREKIISRR